VIAFARAARLALLAVLLACAGIVVAATPASAHGLGGLTPTNYESRLVRVAPAVTGITVRVTDLGNRLELTNSTSRDVVVLGYSGEPYLRVGPHGVFENTRSPATYLNKSTTLSSTPPPKSADPNAPPVWKQISSGTTARWHDHRAHFMGTSDPPVVTRDRSHRHVIDHWTIDIRDGDRTIAATGEITWVPPPSPWPYVGVALVLALTVFGLSRTRAWKWVMCGALVLLIVLEAVHVVGAWGASSSSSFTKLVQSLYSIGGIAVGVLALVWAKRRGVTAAVPLIVVSAIVLLVAGGLADVTSLGHSQLPTTLPWALARAMVAVVLGVASGLAAASAFRLRPAGPRRAPARHAARPRVTVTS
jgi:hypothetical protein